MVFSIYDEVQVYLLVQAWFKTPVSEIKGLGLFLLGFCTID